MISSPESEDALFVKFQQTLLIYTHRLIRFGFKTQTIAYTIFSFHRVRRVGKRFGLAIVTIMSAKAWDLPVAVYQTIGE